MRPEVDLDLEDVTPLQPGQILADSVRQWRPDCQVGQFKIGSTILRGSKIDMEMVCCALFDGEFYGYKPQRWLGIVFIDPDGVLSSILFKTESMDNFAELRRSYLLKGQSLLGKVITARMNKRTSMAKGKPYFAVEFEVANEGKYAPAIIELRKQLTRTADVIQLIEHKKDKKDSDDEQEERQVN